MQRTETESGLFTPGNPETGEKGGRVSKAWLDSIQEEVCSVIEAAGIDLDPNQRNQLLQAIPIIVLGTVHEDIGGSGKKMRLAFRAIEAEDGSVSWALEPQTIA